MLPETIDIPDTVITIARRLSDEGYEVWCVGGVVRDVALGEVCTDVDLATSALPSDVQRIFRRTVPVGIEHGTVAILDADNQTHEITTFRRDVTTDGRHAEVAFDVTLEEDLARRDFTINAIAFHPLTHEFRDPFDGQGDLESGVIRCVGEPKVRFSEDYLRILRALRFASRFAFQIDAATWDAAVALIDETKRLSAERVREEWFRGLATAKSVGSFIELWRTVGALRVWFPEMDTSATDWSERVANAERLPARDPVLITSLLAGDGATVLKKLKASNIAINRATSITRHIDRYPDPMVAAQVRRWLARVDEAADDLIHLANAREIEPELATAVRDVRASGAALKVGHLQIDGRGLGQLGVPSGPEMGRILRTLLEEVLEDPSLNSPEWLTEKTRDLICDD
jgi:tRNA nucleotidyltransferase (CCA-adding enzyme)